jgi:hypothetical protein
MYEYSGVVKLLIVTLVDGIMAISRAEATMLEIARVNIKASSCLILLRISLPSCAGAAQQTREGFIGRSKRTCPL